MGDEVPPFGFQPFDWLRTRFLLEFDVPSVTLQPVPTTIDWARLAAFIDGEGTIYINSQKPSGGRKTKRHFLCVVITNTNPKLLLWIQRTFGGSIYEVKGTARSKFSKKIIYRWQVNETLAEVILKECLPYFVMKREHAEIGLAFRELKRKQNGCKGPGVPLSEEVLSARQSLADQIVAVNRRTHTPLNLVQ